MWKRREDSELSRVHQSSINTYAPSAQMPSLALVLQWPAMEPFISSSCAASEKHCNDVHRHSPAKPPCPKKHLVGSNLPRTSWNLPSRTSTKDQAASRIQERGGRQKKYKGSLPTSPPIYLLERVALSWPWGHANHLEGGSDLAAIDSLLVPPAPLPLHTHVPTSCLFLLLC